MSDPYEKIDRFARVLERIMASKFLMGLITCVLGLIFLAVYINRNGPAL